MNGFMYFDRRWKRIFVFALCLCISITCFTACGEKKVEGNSEEINTDAEDATLSETSEGIPEHVKEELSTGAGTIKVDAAVINAENFGRLPVATMTIKDWSEDEIENYAAAVFDEGSAEVILPYKRRDINTLLEDQAEVEARIKELGYTTETIYYSSEYRYLGYQLATIQYYIEHHNESTDLENDGSYQWIIEESVDNQKAERRTCQIKGTIDGKEYGLLFDTGGIFSGNSMTLRQVKGQYYAEENFDYYTTIDMQLIEDADFYLFYLGKFSEGGPVNKDKLSPDSSLYTENVCSVSEQQAVEQVEDFVSQLGLDDFLVSGVYQARPYIYEYDEETDEISSQQVTKGWLVYLGRAVSGVTTPCIEEYMGNSCWDSQEVNGELGQWTTYGYEGIVAFVTDDGIEEFQYYNPMEVSEISAEQAEVTEFNKIYQSTIEYLKSEDATYDIDKIELCMGRVKYDEDSYALVPVWCYEYELKDYGGDSLSYRQAVIVNAIDGSVIDVTSGRPVER